MTVVGIVKSMMLITVVSAAAARPYIVILHGQLIQ